MTATTTSTTTPEARAVTGSAAVSAAECVNPRRGKWRVRWAITPTAAQDGGGGEATYMEAELPRRPTPELMAALVQQGEEITDAELDAIGMAAGVGGMAALTYQARAELVAADPQMQLMEVVREQHLALNALTDAQALRVPATFFTFAELCRRGVQVREGVILRYGGKLWRVVQAHTPMAVHPPSIATASLYTRVEPAHAGTLDDPIPYEQGMALTAGLIYEQGGAIYECLTTTASGYPYDLRDMPALARPL